MPKTNVEFQVAEKPIPVSTNWRAFIMELLDYDQPVRVKWMEYAPSSDIFRRRLWKACLPFGVRPSVRLDRADDDYVLVGILPKKMGGAGLEILVESAQKLEGSKE